MRKFINKKAVRNFALGACIAKWQPHGSVMRSAYMPTRVSQRFYDDLNAYVQSYIVNFINNRPNKGVTL